MERNLCTTGLGDTGKTILHDTEGPKSIEVKQAMAQNRENVEYLQFEGNNSYAASSTGKILELCTQTCARVSRNLESFETYDTGEISGLMMLQSMRVLERRLHIWGQIATFSFDDSPECYLRTDHPLQTLTKINGVLCDLDRGVVGLHSPHIKDQRTSGAIGSVEIGNYPKASKLFYELINLIDTLYTQLPEIWRETSKWALTAMLMVDITPSLIYKGLRGGVQDNIFPMALGMEVPRNLLTMFFLLDEMINTVSPPMSYESGLLKSSDFVCQGFFDGIGVYFRHSNIYSPSPGGFITVHTAWQSRGTPGDMTNTPIMMEHQKRLQLPKPEEMRVLVLAGYLENRRMGRVEIMYHTPEWASRRSAPVSLRRLLAEKQFHTSMKVRISIARKLACALLYFHACHWIHGNISDRNIIFFNQSESGLNFSEPFFCDFAPVPEEKLATLSETVYRGSSGAGGYHFRSKSHDIYQLGWVILQLVLDEEAISRLHHLESGQQPRKDDFELLITQSVQFSVMDKQAAVSLKDAVMGCLSGQAALEGNIQHDEEFNHCTGLYWRVVRPLDHCLSLLMKVEEINSVFPTEICWTGRRTLGLEGYRRGSQEYIEGVVESKITRENSSPRISITNIQGVEATNNLHEKIIEKDRKQIYPVNADPSQIKNWQKDMLPRLEKILELYLPPTESASIDLLGIGTSRETSRPTIVVTCKSNRQIKAHILKKFSYDANTFDLKIRKGFVRRSSSRKVRSKESARRSTGLFSQDCSNRQYQPKPLSGASIGACLDGQPLPPGTYGGLILIDGQPYGMTVHHLLDPESEGEETDDESAEDDFSVIASEDERGYDFGGESLVGTSSNTDVDSMPVYWDDGESDEGSDSLTDELERISNAGGFEPGDQFLAPEDIRDASNNVSETSGDVGDIPGLDKDHGMDIVITQPAQDDLVNQESFEFEQSIGAYKLGTILASSGIRRVTIGSEKHEIDWALIQISSQRLGGRNIIRGGGKYLPTAGSPDLEPCAIVPMTELSELSVHATGRTSGLQGGVISPAMSSVRLHGRQTFSKSWHVVGNLGIPGDSGSWVVDNGQGRVCGHILARCSTRRVSYIVPMELLLQDIKETLKADCVGLPTVATEVGRLLDEALARLEDTSIDIQRGSGRDSHLCPGSSPSTGAGGSDDIIPLAY